MEPQFIKGDRVQVECVPVNETYAGTVVDGPFDPGWYAVKCDTCPENHVAFDFEMSKIEDEHAARD